MAEAVQRVLVAGATGMLGAKIAHALFDQAAGGPDREVSLLVRRGSTDDPKKRDGLQRLTDRGAVIVEGDLAQPESLGPATQGIDVVISAVQGGRAVIVDGQRALLEAAQRNGVRRLIPSDFAIDLFKVEPGQHLLLNLRREADEIIAESGLEYVHVLNGVFMDYFFQPAFGALDLEKGEVTFYGDGDQKIDMTTTDDTARYTAAAALDRDLPSGKFAVAGDQISMRDAATVIESVKGRPLTRRSLGTLADLERKAEAAKAEIDPDSGDPSRFAIFYQRVMFSGRAKLEDVQNERYPHLRPQTLRDYLATAQVG